MAIQDGAISQPIELIDLNYGDCGISTPKEPRPGQTIKLTVLDRGSMPAEALVQ